MKKISIRLVAMCLVVLMLSMVLASCGNKLSGTYENHTLGLTITYTFSSKEFTRTMHGLTQYDAGMVTSGTYRIEKDVIYLTSSEGVEEEFSFSQSGKTIYISGLDFVQK